MDNITHNPNFPALTQLGYQIERELGQNRSGGRVTYLATDTKTQQPVVIKQFQFARVGASWSDYEAHEREITLLQQLNSPSIPNYLDAFETSEGFCLIQEYKPAPSLAVPQPFTPQEVKEIAIAILKVLVYLQQQVPPIIHRDIKPENILVERAPALKVYLVDFGLARPVGTDMAASSVVKGTLGFMPPEQIFNRQLTAASDLYSLGATLICLLTQTKSTDIGNLMDEAYRINFKPLVSGLNPEFIAWLEKMVAPNLKHRYPNAATAIAALEPIDVIGHTRNLNRFNQLSLVANKFLVLKLGLVALLIASFPILHRMINPVNLNNADLRQLQTTGQCRNCNLQGADLRNYNLKGVDLTAADLRGADLRGTDLRSSYLKGANLSNANLTNADLRGAYLENANLANADLRGTNLESADIRGAIMK
ncbi:MAG TPA: protein kinase [Cyanobacteria bacterium UBA8803]|nr:protein kinase [Cyanobacteria bacterium UBA9273]HBL62552.1 protein kinase [Cyanobacteria bacterium UBA8803]